MDTKELMAERKKLQTDMRDALDKLVGQFEADSGIRVSDIGVHFVNVSSADGYRVIISDVTVKLEIE